MPDGTIGVAPPAGVNPALPVTSLFTCPMLRARSAVVTCTVIGPATAGLNRAVRLLTAAAGTSCHAVSPLPVGLYHTRVLASAGCLSSIRHSTTASSPLSSAVDMVTTGLTVSITTFSAGGSLLGSFGSNRPSLNTS
jgi:enoyl-[acyl-carrier-protein] reductase (NADH)